jgi:simple sugar transport system substrate-binding protein/basic membrane protein A
MYKAKRSRWTLAILLTTLMVLAFIVAACAGAPAPTQAPPTQAATSAPQASKAKMALVLIGPKDDNSWAASAYSALQAEAGKGVDTAFSESVKDTDAARVMREYVAKGYNIIIAHSFSFQDAVFQVATDSPKVNFAWAGGINHTAKNVADYDQPFYEPSYLVGILAGYMSKSGHLGALYGFDIPVCHSMGEAMLAGAKTVKPNATLTVTEVGDWGDVSKAKEAGLAQVDTAGVDYWIGCGEGPTLGSIEAAKTKGGYATGYVGDMSKLAPDVVLSSVVWNMQPIFDKMVDETTKGTFSGPFYRFGVAEGALDVAINPALKSKVPAEALTAMDKAKADIKSGALKVPFVPSK